MFGLFTGFKRTGHTEISLTLESGLGLRERCRNFLTKRKGKHRVLSISRKFF